MIGTMNNDASQGLRFKGCLDEIGVWDEVLPLETIQGLAAGASPIGAPSPDSGYLRVTDISYDPDTGNISMTWNSREGAVSYRLLYDDDLSGDFLAEVDDNIPTQGETTTVNFNRSEVGGAGALKVFFIVQEN